jgi:type III secretion system YscQ/HrcQ family protein
MTTAAITDRTRPRPRRVRPYPLDELPRLLRTQVELGRVLWRHLWALLDTTAAGGNQGPLDTERFLGGPLSVSAQEPYLAPADRLPSLLRGARLLEASVLAPGQQRAVLVLDDKLCQRLELGSDDRLLSALDRVLAGAPVRLASLDSAEAASAILREDASSRSLLVLDLLLSARGETGWARLVLGAQLRLRSAPPPSSAALRRARQRLHRLEGTQASLCIEAGFGFLPAQSVLSLQPADIVLLDHFGPKPVTGGPVWLRLGGGVFPAHLDGAGVTVLGSFHLRAQDMAEQPPNESPNPSFAADTAPLLNEALLRELPVQLTCEIGRVTMNAREVLELRPGAVLPVGRPLAGPVDLTAGGRVIARGELVDVEGEIGIRITEVLD